nr:microtubule-associated protein tortifolia1 [Quercus suber]
MLLNSLYEVVSSDLKPSAGKDSLCLLAFTCTAHPDSSSAHLTTIISHVIKRLKDFDSAIHDACHDAIGSLSDLYLKPPASSGNDNNESAVGLFMRPLFKTMGEQNKVV